jgi:hypothetical protein
VPFSYATGRLPQPPLGHVSLAKLHGVTVPDGERPRANAGLVWRVLLALLVTSVAAIALYFTFLYGQH